MHAGMSFNHGKRVGSCSSRTSLYTMFRGDSVRIPVEAGSNWHHIGSIRELAGCGHHERTPVPDECWVILGLGVRSVHSPGLRWSSLGDYLRWVVYGMGPSRFRRILLRIGACHILAQRFRRIDRNETLLTFNEAGWLERGTAFCHYFNVLLPG